MRSSENKKFIILQEDDKGFMLENKKPSGYTKIENKDSKYKISYYVQNIDKNNTYNLNLIIDRDSKIEVVSIGESKPDATGKIEISYDFDEELLDLVCGSAVCVKDFKGEVKYPLSGFLAKKRIFNWKVNQFRGIKSRPFRKETYINLVNKQQPKVTKKEIIEESNEEENLEQQEIKEDTQENNQEEIQETLCEDLRNADENYELDAEEVYKTYESNAKNVIESRKNKYERARHHILALKRLLAKDDGGIEKMIKRLLPVYYTKDRRLSEDYEYRFFLNVLNEYEEIESLSDEEYTFFKIPVESFSYMRSVKDENEVKYGVIFYPMMFMYPYFKDKGYFIVGLNYNDENNISNLIYGIEVDEGKEEVLPYDGKMGFNKYLYDYENSRAYHIMEYDYKKAEVK